MNLIESRLSSSSLCILIFVILAIFFIGLSPTRISAQGTWELIYDDLYGTLSDIFFVDEFEGWVVDWQYLTPGRIYHTIDGGFSWEIQDDPSNNGLFTVFFLNDSVGWAGGLGGVILRTVDGGENWIQEYSAVANHVEDIFFLDENLGWCVGGLQNIAPYPKEYFISHTVDGGDNWMVLMYDTTNESGIFRCVRFANVLCPS